MDKKQKALEILKRLKKVYPDAKIALDFGNPFQLLIATILAAQANDITVNKELIKPVLGYLKNIQLQKN
jgi:endonuclease III